MIELLLGEQSVQPGQNAAIDLYVAAAKALKDEAVRRKSSDYITEMARKNGSSGANAGTMAIGTFRKTGASWPSGGSIVSNWASISTCRCDLICEPAIGSGRNRRHQRPGLAGFQDQAGRGAIAMAAGVQGREQR